jgi:MoaA/NifB/PqqE/SkfB family radical SAM enzyme
VAAKAVVVYCVVERSIDMHLSGLHLLLTYQCNFECDHCFVWGSPWQSGTMTLRDVRRILRQARNLRTVEWIYFEGGEPFLYYATLLKGVQEAVQMGFQVGVVSNSYWATDEDDALVCLEPFAGLVQDLSISSDLYHYSQELSQQAKHACLAAERLGIPIGVISIAQIESTDADVAVGQLPVGESDVMYRGRAVEKLVPQAERRSWEEFTECPHEDLREPGRLHVDPFGNLHTCQGISIGNLFHRPLGEICETYDPELHPITSPLLEGGPMELVRRYELPHEATYADACHLCYAARQALRARFPEALTPDQMYGVM